MIFTWKFMWNFLKHLPRLRFLSKHRAGGGSCNKDGRGPASMRPLVKGGLVSSIFYDLHHLLKKSNMSQNFFYLKNISSSIDADSFFNWEN